MEETSTSSLNSPTYSVKQVLNEMRNPINDMGDAVEATFSPATNTLSVSEVAPAEFQNITVTLQNGITAAATSAAVDVSMFSKHTFQFKMTTSHTTVMQATVDGTNWVAIGKDIHGTDISAGSTTSNIVQVEGKFRQIRVNTTAVSGALLVTYMGGN
jgi:hypothetical protein